LYISKITLKNIRGFRSLEFDLERSKGEYAGWTVFTGSNGSGKSTLIRAIAICIAGKDVARSFFPSFRGWTREGGAPGESSIQLGIASVSTDDSKRGRPSKAPFVAKLAFEQGDGPEPSLVSRSPKKPKKAAVPDQSIWSSNPKGWFACGYGPFRRVFGASPEAQRQMSAPSTERWVTLFQEAASLREVDEWLKDLKYKALEGKDEQKKELDVLLKILGDEFLPAEIRIDDIDSGGLWLRDGNDVRLSWAEMSDGYRAALALLADILRHMINAYGFDDLYESDEGGQIRIKRSGVVLIDEIDAHLHPSWQRQIGFWLKSHFPKVQFLVTSHSPIILQAADQNGLFVLPEPGSEEGPHRLSKEEYLKIIASTPDTALLSDAFRLQNTRSPLAVERRARYARLQGKKRAGAHLSESEAHELGQLQLFVSADPE
jgi:energy-coupling factor transporter ATP-binding protein EcfA2